MDLGLVGASMDKHLRRVKNLRSELGLLKRKFEQLASEAEYVRSYYKYQNSETDSLSEDFIVSFSNQDVDGAFDAILDLLDYEERK